MRALTAGAGVDDEPEISRDGSRLVYANRRDQSSLMAWDPVSGRSQTLAESASVQWLPEVSPKGDRISFFANVAGDMQLFSINRAGSDLRQLTFAARQDHMHPSWSPDGSAIYYYSQRTLPPTRHGHPSRLVPRRRTHLLSAGRDTNERHRLAY